MRNWMIKYRYFSTVCSGEVAVLVTTPAPVADGVKIFAVPLAM